MLLLLFSSSSCCCCPHARAHSSRLPPPLPPDPNDPPPTNADIPTKGAQKALERLNDEVGGLPAAAYFPLISRSKILCARPILCEQRVH